MTVKELIEQLSKYDGDTPVVTRSDDDVHGGYYHADDAVHEMVFLKKATGWGELTPYYPSLHPDKETFLGVFVN